MPVKWQPLLGKKNMVPVVFINSKCHCRPMVLECLGAFQFREPLKTGSSAVGGSLTFTLIQSHFGTRKCDPSGGVNDFAFARLWIQNPRTRRFTPIWRVVKDTHAPKESENHRVRPIVDDCCWSQPFYNHLCFQGLNLPQTDKIVPIPMFSFLK